MVLAGKRTGAHTGKVTIYGSLREVFPRSGCTYEGTKFSGTFEIPDPGRLMFVRAPAQVIKSEGGGCHPRKIWLEASLRGHNGRLLEAGVVG